MCFCFAIALGLLILGGEGHLFFANSDWLWRDAVLADVARGPFPPTYQVGDQTFILRAPLGMYMLPALIAKASSLAVGHAGLLIQNVSLFALVLYMLATIAGQRAALATALFLSFSGMDAVGEVLVWLLKGHSLSSFVLPSHIESWIGLQYSSVVTQLFWVPNHALPAYWLVILVLLVGQRELAIGELGIVTAAALFWSPFAFIGIIPFASFLLVRDWRSALTSRHFWLAVAAASCFLPIALYMKVDAAQVPHGLTVFEPWEMMMIAIFLILELTHVAAVLPMLRRIPPLVRHLFLVAVGFLVVLPTVRLGFANDLVMRASIPSLMILSFALSHALGLAWPKRPWVVIVGACVIAIGAITPAQEIDRTLSVRRFAISDCNLATVWKEIGKEPTLENYFARQASMPDWLIARDHQTTIVPRPQTPCWPDLPFDADLDIHKASNETLRKLSDESKEPGHPSAE